MQSKSFKFHHYAFYLLELIYLSFSLYCILKSHNVLKISILIFSLFFVSFMIFANKTNLYIKRIYFKLCDSNYKHRILAFNIVTSILTILIFIIQLLITSLIYFYL